nr:MAG TPA: hypothetical protein [Caudoviricetes sp.]
MQIHGLSHLALSIIFGALKLTERLARDRTGSRLKMALGHSAWRVGENFAERDPSPVESFVAR